MQEGDRRATRCRRGRGELPKVAAGHVVAAAAGNFPAVAAGHTVGADTECVPMVATARHTVAVEREDC